MTKFVYIERSPRLLKKRLAMYREVWRSQRAQARKDRCARKYRRTLAMVAYRSDLSRTILDAGTNCDVTAQER